MKVSQLIFFFWRMWLRKCENVISTFSVFPTYYFPIPCIIASPLLGQVIPGKIFISPNHCLLLVLDREGRDLILIIYDLLIDCYKKWCNGCHL